MIEGCSQPFVMWPCTCSIFIVCPVVSCRQHCSHGDVLRRELWCHSLECFFYLINLSASLNPGSCTSLCDALVAAAQSDLVNLERMHTSEGTARVSVHVHHVHHVINFANDLQ